MKLTTIDDLNRPAAEKNMLIERAMQLGKWYGEFKASDTETHKYEVEIHGERGRAPGIHASEISKCQRLLTYSIQGVQRRPVAAGSTDVNMKLRFAIGHAVHAMLQSDFQRMCERFNGALTFEPEVRIHPGLGGAAAQWGMSSSCDGIFTFWHEGQAYLRVGLEIKTASDKEYEKTLKPKDEHYDQTCLYQKALDLPLMWILNYNKSNSNWTNSEPPWLFQFNAQLWHTKLEPTFAEATRCAQANQLPPREEGRPCRWCPFAWTCQPPSLRAQSGRGPSSTLHNPGALRVQRTP